VRSPPNFPTFLGDSIFYTPITTGSVVDLFEGIGRAVMDLGLSGVIDKFEEHWGKPATKVLLAIIGLTITCLCLAAIWSTVLWPLVEFVNDVVLNNPSPHTRAIVKFLVYLSFVLAGVNLGLGYLDRYVNWKLNAQLLRKIKEARQIVTETKENLVAAQKVAENARFYARVAGKTLDRAFEFALEKNMLTQQDVDAISADVEAFLASASPPA